MNIRRSAIIASIFCAVLAGGSAGQTPAAPPARTQPATAADAVAASQPGITSPAGLKWLERKGKKGRKYIIGSLDSPPQGGAGGYVFQVELIADGAAINTVKLRKYFATVADKKLAEKDIQAYHKTLKDNPGKLGGHYSLLNTVSHGDARYRPLATRRITVTFADLAEPVSWNLQDLPWRHEPREKATAGGDSQSVSFSWTLFRQDAPKAKRVAVLKLLKTYTVRKEDYTINMSLKVENLSGGALEVSIDQYGPTGVPREGHRQDMRRVVYGVIKGKDNNKPQTLARARQTKLDEVEPGKRDILGNSASEEPVLWVGQDNKFFGAMVYLVPAVEGRLRAPTWKADFYFENILENDTSSTQMTGIAVAKLHLGAGGSRTVNFSLFCGPKRREMFVDEDAPYFNPLYKKLDYASTIQLRSCFCAWDWLSLSMIWLLRAISTVTFGNFGVAIFILVIMVRLALHPMTKKSQLAMSKMKKLGPMMKELEKKYADDKEALNRERIRMYKQQGAGPMLLGCLPMLLQMPILIALYTGINASIDLRHAAFLPVWITDLAAPDRLYTWTKALPLIGTEFNLLPFLLGGAMYWQMKLSPQSNQVGATDEQRKQQKMMGVMMPVMMLFIFYRMNSGLTLYFLSSTFFGAAESHFIRKHIEAKEALAAAMETTVHLPGKAARGSRPKKPKGPNFVKRG